VDVRDLDSGDGGAVEWRRRGDGVMDRWEWWTGGE
jgi:hypothetical protein